MTGSQSSSSTATAAATETSATETDASNLLTRLQNEPAGTLDPQLREELAKFLEQSAEATAPCNLPHHDPEDDRFRLIFARAPLGLSLVDDDGRILEVNQHLLNMFGLTRDQYVGKNSFDFLHPESLEEKRRHVEMLMKGEETSYQLVEKRFHSSGKAVWIRVTATRLYDPIKRHMVRLNMVENIHDAKAAQDASEAAQKKFQDVTNAIPGGVYEYCLHPDGKEELIFANAGFGHIFEIPSAEIIADVDKVYECIDPADQIVMRESVRASAAGLTPWVMEFHIVTPKGNEKWLCAEALPQKQPDGRIIWHGLVTDITSRKSTEEELRKAKDQAEKATRAKSEFLTNISHEIRTPMNAVLGFSELLATELKDPIHRQYLQSIRSAGSTLLHLINDFLDLSRIEAGKITLHREAISLTDLLDDIRRLFLIKTNEKGLEFWTHIDARVPQFVLADETRLRQVLFNLVGNAVKFTRQGYVGVKIRRLRMDPALNQLDLALIVEDTGVGIQQEDQGRIFDSFEQQRNQSREFGGTGLGLAICRRIVEAMGGSIQLDSQPERGSTFTVTLPGLAVADESERLPQSTSEPLRKLRFKGGQVLVVDDNEANRNLIQGYLSDTGLEVREAINAEEALRALKTRKPDLLLLDLRMPGTDGLEIARTLRARQNEHYGEVPTVVLTANPDSRHRPELQELNLQGFLLKPVSRRDLLALLAKVLPQDLIDSSEPETDDDLLGERGQDWREVEKSFGRDSLPPSVQNRLEVIIRDQLAELMAAPDVDDVQKLALELLQLAELHSLPVLQRFARQLTDAIAIFDVAMMTRLISELPEFLNS